MMGVANPNIIFLQKTAARKALNHNNLSIDQYKNIIKKLEELEEIMRYEKKLKEYKISETKEKLHKEYTSV
jgi:hypothetical protein